MKKPPSKIMPYMQFPALLLILLWIPLCKAQTENKPSENILSFEAYLGYVKKYHPLMKQAGITLRMAEANMLKARGGFDPKIEIDYDRKKFMNTPYYDRLNATFKIPTWYGIAFKGNFEDNTGAFLNPEFTVPENGLYSAGVSFALARGFLINERMAMLKKARLFKAQSKAQRDLMINALLFEASMAYFDWMAATNEVGIFERFLENAETRLEAITRSAAAGEKADIDIVEARITLQNRTLGLEAAKLKKRKTALMASNFLWQNDIPVELQDDVVPQKPEISTLETCLFLDGITDTTALALAHPKLLSLSAKIDRLTVDQRLKRNELLPELDLQYNFLSTERDQFSAFSTANYKAFLNFSFPLFLRKERGSLRLANLKIQNAIFDRYNATLAIQNQIAATTTEIESLSVQKKLIETIVADSEVLVKAEERKFFLGASSLFLINSREQKLIDVQLKANDLLRKQLGSTAKLYKSLGISTPEKSY